MFSMRSSGTAVFTTQNPFPRDPPEPKSHYSPTRATTIPKQQKGLALSPVRFTRKPLYPKPPETPLKKEDPVFHEGSHRVVLCPPKPCERQLNYSESWPSTDLSHSTSNSTSPCSESKMDPARETTGAKEPTVLAKYIERFRYGRPQSREDRLREAAEDEEGRFWWMSTSPPSSSTPTQASDRHPRESTDLNPPLSARRPISTSPVRDMFDFSMLTLSEPSHCDPEEPEILKLQERANRLLQKSEHSLGSDSVPISSEGLGCSDFSSPVSLDEQIRTGPTFMASANLSLDPIFREGPSSHTSFGSVGSGVRREDDILFQWRLRRKMEQARQSCQETSSHNSLPRYSLEHTLGPNQAFHSHLHKIPHHKSQLEFTPVILSSHEPEPALPISSPSVSRLQRDATIRIQEQPKTLIKPDTLPHGSRETVTKNVEVTEFNMPEIVEEHHTRQKSSSPKTKSKDERWPDTQGKKSSSVNGKMEGIRNDKTASTRRKKKPARVERSSSPERASRAKGHEGVTRKVMEASGKSRCQEEGQRPTLRRRSKDQAPPPSPIHNALGQVVSEVLFSGVDSPTQCKTSSSVSPAFTSPSPPHSPYAPRADDQRPFEVIDQLMQDAEDSDGKEFEDDPLLQVLRRQRKWVKEQLGEVDVMLERFLPLTSPTGT